jgi:hypothetical protein
MSTEVVNKIIKRMLIAIKHNGEKIELRKNARKELHPTIHIIRT